MDYKVLKPELVRRGRQERGTHTSFGSLKLKYPCIPDTPTRWVVIWITKDWKGCKGNTARSPGEKEQQRPEEQQNRQGLGTGV
jgi:hypothetical protein